MICDVKILARRVLRAPLYDAARSLWRGLQEFKDWARGFWVGVWLLATRFGLPDALFYFGVAPGDDLLCTAVLRELRKRGKRRLWMLSNYPELFAGIDDASHIIPVAYRDQGFARVWRLSYVHLRYALKESHDRSTSPRRHIIAELCARAGVSGSVDLKPYLSLTESEEITARGLAAES